MPPLSRRLERLLRRRAAGGAAGAYRSLFRGAGQTFRDARPYAPGDDARRIDWNVTARAGAPFTKQFDEERDQTLWLAVDASGSVGAGAAETAAELAALLAVAALSAGDRVGLVRFAGRVLTVEAPLRGPGAAPRLLAALAEPPREGAATDLAAPLHFLAGRARRGLAFVVSDFLADGWDAALGRVSRRHDVICARVVAPFTADWPAAGLYRLRDAETGRVLLLNGRDAGFRAALARQGRERAAAFARRVASAGAAGFSVDAGADPLAALERFLARR